MSFISGRGMITHWDNVKAIWVSVEPQDILNLHGFCVLQLFGLCFQNYRAWVVNYWTSNLISHLLFVSNFIHLQVYLLKAALALSNVKTFLEMSFLLKPICAVSLWWTTLFLLAFQYSAFVLTPCILQCSNHYFFATFKLPPIPRLC